MKPCTLKKFKLILISLLLVTIPLTRSISSQQTTGDSTVIKTAEKIIQSTLSLEKGYDWLQELSAIGTRMNNSAGIDKAMKWAVHKLKAIGCDTAYLQETTGGVIHWLPGTITSAKIVNSKHFGQKKLAITALGGSVGTPHRGLTAPIIEIKTKKEFIELTESEVKGKIVFVNIALDKSIFDLGKAYPELSTFRIWGPRMVSNKGGVAFILRSITTRMDNVTHTGVTLFGDSIKNPIPSVAIGNLDANFLSRALSKDPNLSIELVLNCKFLPDKKSYNVIGEIRGSEKPNEIILIGGHIDSWEKGDASHDDGAGCIHAMETIDIFKRLAIQPKRTIRCVLFVSEEARQVGGVTYEAYASKSSEIHLAAIESDFGGLPPLGITVDADTTTVRKLQEITRDAFSATNFWVRSGDCGADVLRIRSAHFRGELLTDLTRYFDYHHSDNDIIENVNPRELELGSVALALFAFALDQKGIDP